MISDDEMFRRHMGKVVDQAIDEERERCALICREYAKEWAGFPAHESAAEEIEKRIRSEE